MQRLRFGIVIPTCSPAGSIFLWLPKARAKQHLIAFARLGQISAECEAPDVAAVVIVPRLTTSLTTRPAAAPVGEAVWSDTLASIA